MSKVRRPKKLQHSLSFKFVLSEAEKKMLEELAAKAGVSEASFLRTLIREKHGHSP